LPTDDATQESGTPQLGVVAERIEHRQELMLHSQQIVTPTEFMEAYDA